MDGEIHCSLCRRSLKTWSSWRSGPIHQSDFEEVLLDRRLTNIAKKKKKVCDQVHNGDRRKGKQLEASTRWVGLWERTSRRMSMRQQMSTFKQMLKIFYWKTWDNSSTTKCWFLAMSNIIYLLWQIKIRYQYKSDVS